MTQSHVTASYDGIAERHGVHLEPIREARGDDMKEDDASDLGPPKLMRCTIKDHIISKSWRIRSKMERDLINFVFMGGEKPEFTILQCQIDDLLSIADEVVESETNEYRKNILLIDPRRVYYCTTDQEELKAAILSPQSLYYSIDGMLAQYSASQGCGSIEYTSVFKVVQQALEMIEVHPSIRRLYNKCNTGLGMSTYSSRFKIGALIMAMKLGADMEMIHSGLSNLVNQGFWDDDMVKISRASQLKYYLPKMGSKIEQRWASQMWMIKTLLMLMIGVFLGL